MVKKHAKSRKKKTAFSSGQQSRRPLVVYAIVFILAGIPFALGKYIEFNSPGPFDSGAYVYSAAHIINGATIGVEEKPSAHLGTLLVNLLGVRLFGFNDVGPKIVQMVMQAMALALMFFALRKAFGTLPAAVGVVIASTFLSSPLLAKFGNVKEQYMIACMIMGVSSFVIYQPGGKWWWALLAGAFLSWAPLFKPTGTSAIGAVVLFVVLQPFLKNKTFKQTGIDICLLLAGVATALSPLYIWIIGWDIQLSLPYSFAWVEIEKGYEFVTKYFSPDTLSDSVSDSTEAAPKREMGYIGASRRMVPFSQQWPRVLRYYGLLILPVTLGIAALIARLTRMISSLTRNWKLPQKPYDRFVLLLVGWWILDMAFVWISPRSYEQYYLPLTASAAMAGGYLIALYADKTKNTVRRGRWVLVGMTGFLIMIFMSWHLFFGIDRSPFSGRKYSKKQKGYAQALKQIQLRKTGSMAPWESVGKYIRTHSSPADKIYVWGWFPGIYVQAQRFSPTTPAFMMPRPSPDIFKKSIDRMVADFEKQPPRFIVDPRKNHIPLDRLPYDLWPVIPKKFMAAKRSCFLPLDTDFIVLYNKIYFKSLQKRFGKDEALRFEYLKPLREYIRKNYRIVDSRKYVELGPWPWLGHRYFGKQILFELKNPDSHKAD